MNYTRGNAQESKLHDTYHSNTTQGIEWNTKLSQSIKLVDDKDDLKVLKIKYSDIKSKSKIFYKLQEIHNQLNASLNSPSLPSSILATSSTYIILRDNHVIASAIVSPWNSAFRLYSQSNHSNLIINRYSKTKIKFGIHRIHVINKYRRTGLGTLLLNSMAQTEIYGYTLSPNEIAFSQPTSDGSNLAASWFNSSNAHASNCLNYLVFQA